MAGIRKTERLLDSNLTEQIKLRVSKEQLLQLNKVANITNTYMSTVVRKAVVKYLADLGVN